MPTKKLFASLLFLAACGSSADTGADAQVQTTNATAIVANADGFVADVEVVFVNADGKVAAEGKTDATGRAYAVIEPGASVTATVDGLTTVLGVNPGDTITFGRTTDATLGKDNGALAVKFQAAAGATKVDLVTSCSSVSGAASPLSLPVHSDCTDSGPLLAVASDATGVISYAVADGVLVKKGSYELKSAWKPADAITVSVSNSDPAVIGALKVQTASEVGYAADVANFLPGAAAESVKLKATLGEHAGYALFVADKAGTHHQVELAPLAKDTTDVKLDLSKELLAWVTGVSYDATTRSAKVTTTAGDKGGVLQVDLAYGSKAWHVFGPSNGAVALPTLPASWAAREPAATDAVTGTAALIDVEGEGYDTLHVLAPMAQYHYAGHPEISAKKIIRISK
jgi:hypothetical protein